MALHLMRPEWLWCLAPALVLVLLLWRQRKRRGSWSAVIAPELLHHLVGDSSTSRGVNLLPLVLLGWVLAVFAASGPSWQKMPQPVHRKQDALVVLLDLSYSMKSADLAPSRLDRARQKILDLLQLRREGQTGLIAYAGDAHIVTPLTDDTPTIANLLPALHPDMMPVPGSDAAGAVTQGLELLRSAGVRDGKLLLVTDGVSDEDRRAIAKALRGAGAQLTVMGLGTPTGAPIPLPDGGFLKDQSGTIVMPGLDEGALRDLAAAAGGSYLRMRIDSSDLEQVLAENPLTDRGQTLALERTADAWEDQGYIFILALLPLALGLFRRGWLLTLLPVLLLARPEPAAAQSWEDLWLTPDQQGQQALQRGDNETAAALFEDARWAGTAAYRDEDYEQATERFAAGDDADSWYNRGNALARAGQLDEAIAAYEESLERLPDQTDAMENLELVKNLRDQQQQQQQQSESGDNDDQQEQQQQQQQGQQDGNSDQDQDQNQQESGQDQQQQNTGQQEGQSDEEQQQAQGEQPDGGEQEQEPAQARPEGEEEKEAADSAGQMARAESQERERDQAMEQWLRRVPDDPSGLLREKFRYESRQRQKQGVRKDDETYW